jgi:hypothetical protein
MSFKTDLALAKKGDSAALKKMQAHVSFCIREKNLDGLLFMKFSKVKELSAQIDAGVNKVQSEKAAKAKEIKRLKQVLTAGLNQCDFLLNQNDKRTLPSAALILKQLLEVRYLLPSDQEVYNLDARRISLLAKAQKMGTA